jgi:hypothetical protein
VHAVSDSSVTLGVQASWDTTATVRWHSLKLTASSWGPAVGLAKPPVALAAPAVGDSPRICCSAVSMLRCDDPEFVPVTCCAAPGK